MSIVTSFQLRADEGVDLQAALEKAGVLTLFRCKERSEPVLCLNLSKCDSKRWESRSEHIRKVGVRNYGQECPGEEWHEFTDSNGCVGWRRDLTADEIEKMPMYHVQFQDEGKKIAYIANYASALDYDAMLFISSTLQDQPLTACVYTEQPANCGKTIHLLGGKVVSADTRDCNESRDN